MVSPILLAKLRGFSRRSSTAHSVESRMLGFIAIRRDWSDNTQRNLLQLIFIRLYWSRLIVIRAPDIASSNGRISWKCSQLV